MLSGNFSLCIKTLLNCFVGQPDDENDFPINQEGPTRVIIVSDDDEPREVTYCGEATTGGNKSCFFVLKGDIPFLTYLTKSYCLIKTNKAKLFDLQCRAFGHFGRLDDG